MTDKEDNTPKEDSFYKDELRRSMEDSRASRRRIAENPKPQNDLVILGATGGNGVYQVDTVDIARNGGNRSIGETARGIDFTLYPLPEYTVGVTNGTVDGILPDGMTAGGVPAFTIEVPPDVNIGFIYLAISYTLSDSPPYYLTTSSTIGQSVGGLPGGSEPGSGITYISLGDYNTTSPEGRVLIGSGAGGSGSKMTSLCGGRLLVGAI